MKTWTVILFPFLIVSSSAQETNDKPLTKDDIDQVFNEWFSLHGGHKKNFTLENQSPANWFAAYKNCRGKGMRLATILSKEEDDDVLALIHEHHRSLGSSVRVAYWIAGSDLATERYWYWMTTGNLISGYTNWDPGQPDDHNNTNEDCLAYWPQNNKWQWEDVNCDSVLNYVCETVPPR